MKVDNDLGVIEVQILGQEAIVTVRGSPWWERERWNAEVWRGHDEAIRATHAAEGPWVDSMPAIPVSPGAIWFERQGDEVAVHMRGDARWSVWQWSGCFGLWTNRVRGWAQSPGQAWMKT